jgi:hypothetical protein
LEDGTRVLEKQDTAEFAVETIKKWWVKMGSY